MSTRFVIVGSQRTGTTLVRTNLNSHPDIRCHGEVFKLGRRPYRDAGGFWRWSRSSVPNRALSMLSASRATWSFLTETYDEQGHEAIGFKLMLNHCLARPYIWEHLKQLDVKTILVRRRNVLKTLTSRRAAAESGVYHISDSLNQPSAVTDWQSRKIKLDTETLLDELVSIEQETNTWESMIGDSMHCFRIDYEQYLSNQALVNDKLLDYLGVAPAVLRSDLRKVNPDDLNDLLVNLDEVAGVLRGTRFAHLLG